MIDKEAELRAEIEQLKARLAGVEHALGTRTVQSRSEIYNDLIVQGGAILGGTADTPPPVRGWLAQYQDLPPSIGTPPSGYNWLWSSIQGGGTAYWRNTTPLSYGAFVDSEHISPENPVPYAPAAAGTFQYFPSITMPQAVASWFRTTLYHRPQWSNGQLYCYVFWGGSTAATGNVSFSIECRHNRTGTSATAPVNVSASVTTAMSTQWYVNVSGVNMGRLPNNPGFYGASAVQITRQGAWASDTYLGTVHFLSALFVIYP